MAVEAQRIRGKAARSREERAQRRGETPEDGADLGESPVVDEEDGIARSEARSAFVSTDDMRGLGVPEEGYDPAAATVQLGRDLAEQVDSRMQDWLDGAEQKFQAQLDDIGGAKPQSFVYGAIFGAIAIALGVLLGGRNQNR